MQPPLPLLLLLLLLLLPLHASASSIPVHLPTVANSSGGLLFDIVNSLDGVDCRVDADRASLEAGADDLLKVDAAGAVVAMATAETLSASAAANLTVTQPFAPVRLCFAWRTSQTGESRSGLYFVSVFHSSVWSMLLLSLLVTAAALFTLESTHPLGAKRSVARQRKANKALGVFDTCFCSLGPLVLIGHSRQPVSGSGRVLTIFWWMFAFVMAVCYIGATVLQLATAAGDAETASAAVARATASVCTEDSSSCRLMPLASGVANSPLADAKSLEMRRAGSDAEAASWLLGNDSQPLLMVTSQFACSNLLAEHGNERLSVAIVTNAVAWMTLAAKPSVAESLSNATLQLTSSNRIPELTNRAKVISQSDSSSACRDPIGQLRLALPVRIAAMYGPLLLLGIGYAAAVCAAFSEFVMNRFIGDDEEEDEEEEVEIEVETAEIDEEKRNLRRRPTTDTSNTADTYL